MKILAHTKFLAVVVMLVLFAFTEGIAQKKTPKKKKERSGAEVDNAYSPFSEDGTFDADYSGESKAKKSRKAEKVTRREKKEAFRYSFLKNLDQKKKEFYKRMKKNARDDRKMAREMKKPQYSDPMYFGHKKKPKKRPVGKRKFCRECGIVH